MSSAGSAPGRSGYGAAARAKTLALCGLTGGALMAAPLAASATSQPESDGLAESPLAISEVPLAAVDDVGSGMVLIELEEGGRALAPHGSEVILETPNEGEGLTMGVRPSEELAASSSTVEGPRDPLEATELAIEHGLIPEDAQQQELERARELGASETEVSTSSSSGRTYLDSWFAEPENNTGRAYGRADRFSHDGSSDAFAVDHYATGTSKSTWTLRRVFSGARYTGTGQVTAWAPISDYTGNCQDGITLSASFRGVSASWTQQRCDTHGPDVTSTRFYADWTGRTFSGTRAGYGGHHFTRPVGTQPESVVLLPAE